MLLSRLLPLLLLPRLLLLLPSCLQDPAGNTHLHNAVSGPDDLPDLVSALLAVGLSPDAANSDGDTPLHIAARAGHVGVSAE